MATLFSIGDDLRALMDLLDESGGEITPATHTTLEAWFAEVGRDQSNKLDGYACLIRQLEMEATAATAEKEQWAKKAQARENSAKRLKERLKLYMELSRQDKLQTSTGRIIALQNNGGLLPLELAPTIDPNKLAPAFQRVKVDVDTDAVRAVLEAGQELPFAKLGARGRHVRIR